MVIERPPERLKAPVQLARQIAITLPSLLLAVLFVAFSLTTTLLSFEVRAVPHLPPGGARAGDCRSDVC